jgi:hypothetical protein
MFHVKVINSASQYDRTDIHHDKRAWFGIWGTGVTPHQPSAVSIPSHTISTTSTFVVNPFSAVTPCKPREQCAKANCSGCTVKGCPYRLCTTHCRLAGGCSKHKMKTIRLKQPSSDTSRPSQSNPLASPPSSLGQYQPFSILKEDVLTTALEASSHNTTQRPNATSYSSSSHTMTTITVGSSSAPTISRNPAVLHHPKISTQLEGAWLAVLDANDVDKVEKEKVVLVKAEVAAEAKKNVDILWYDQGHLAHI